MINNSLPQYKIGFNQAGILAYSKGEVVEPETISFRNERPYPNGVLCQKIFGPIRDYECECGKMKGIRFKDKTCPDCGVTVLPSSERFNRMGHIMLVRPTVHPLAYKHVAKLLQLTQKAVKQIAYTESYLRFVPEMSGNIVATIDGNRFVGRFEVLDEAEEDAFSSPNALFEAVKSMDLVESLANSEDEGHRILLSKMIKKNFNPLDYFVQIVPVSPAGYRSVVSMEGFYATSGRNELYQRILRRNIRLRTIIEYGVDDPELLNLENSLLQKAVETLFLGGMMESNGVSLPGVIEGLMGKGGLIRGNLLGKRMDYSGRSVITSGPNLKLDHIGLPYGMAFELYKPFIIRKIMTEYGLRFKRATEVWASRDRIAYDCLEKVVELRRVIMNRQPTLHRLGVMAFKTVLISDKCIRVHPMVCAAFNADFDGDTVAIHVPLTDKAQRECVELLSCGANLLMSANGEPVMAPSHEMVIGLCVMTTLKDYGRGKIYENDIDRLVQLHSMNDDSTNLIHLRVNETLIFCYPDGRKVETCLGRLLIERATGHEVTDFLGKSSIRKIVRDLPNRYHRQQCLDILDDLMQWGLKYATSEGFSVCSDDFKEPPSKKARLAKSNEFERKVKFQLSESEITEQDAYEQIVREWMTTIKDLQAEYVKTAGDDNPIVMMYKTGARVSMSQISQLVVAKGMIANMSNHISEHPIENSLKDGLTPWDYFSSCSGSRKSLSDKKFMTPKSGYLARRLVTAARDLGITEDDCGSTEGVRVYPRDAVGRYGLDGEQIETPPEGRYTTVRSPVTCTAKGGICRKCYGLDPSTNALVRRNTPIGALAAQSLTEPTTQMTMRTFHTSGAATLHESTRVTKSHHTGVVTLDEEGDFHLIKVGDHTYYGKKSVTRLGVKVGDTVNPGDILFGYVDGNLENQDIAGTLPKLEGYFELQDSKVGESSIIATESGILAIHVFDDKLKLYVGQGTGTVFLGEVDGNIVTVPNGHPIEVGDELTVGEVSIKSLYYDRSVGNLKLSAEVFVRKVQALYAGDGIHVDPKHVETIFRAMTELVVMDDGTKGLRSHDKGRIVLQGVIGSGKNYPSWLKAIGFGWIKEILVNAVETGAISYGGRTECVISGSLIPTIIE